MSEPGAARARGLGISCPSSRPRGREDASVESEEGVIHRLGGFRRDVVEQSCTGCWRRASATGPGAAPPPGRPRRRNTEVRARRRGRCGPEPRS